MTKNKVIYKLEKTISYPKQMKQLLRIRAQAEQEMNTKTFIDSSRKLIDLFYETEDYAKVLDHSRELLKYINQLKFSKENILIEIYCFLKMADSCRTMNEFTKAIMFANKGLQVTVKWKLPLDMLDLLFEMGLSYMLRGESDDAQVTDFSDASDTFLKAEKMLESVNLDVVTKDHLRIDIQTNLAIIKKDQGDPDGGIVILEKALNSSTAKQNVDIQANLLCNLAYCHDEKKNYNVSLKLGREEQRMRKAIGDIEGEKQSMLDNATRYEKLRMFPECLKLFDLFESVCLEGKMYSDDLKKDIQEKRNRLLGKIKKGERVAELQKQLHLSKDERHQMLLHEQIGEIQLELGLASQAKASFSLQKNLASHFKVPPSLMIPICLNLCRACMEDGSYNNAEQYIRHAISLLDPSDIDQQISLRQKLVDAIKGASHLTRKNHLTILYNEIIELAERHERYPQFEWCLYGLIELHSFYNMVDNVRVDKSRLERIQKITGGKGKEESSDDDENYQNIEPMEPVSKKMNHDLENDMGERKVSCQKPPIHPKKIAPMNQIQNEYDDTPKANPDFPSPEPIVKKKRKLITLDDIESSQPIIIQPPPVPPLENKKMESSNTKKGKNTASRGLRIVLSSSQYSSQKNNNSVHLESVPSNQYEEALPNTIPIDDFYFEDNDEEADLKRDKKMDEVPPTPHPLPTPQKNYASIESSSPLFPQPQEQGVPTEGNNITTPILLHSGKRNIGSMDQESPIRSSHGVSGKRDEAISRTELGSLSTDTITYPPTPDLQLYSNEKGKESVDHERDLEATILDTVRLVKEGKVETMNQRTSHKYTPKVRVEYCTPTKQSRKVVTVPYPDGPFGTPKTVSWLLNETNMRLKERHGTSVLKVSRILRKGEELCLRDNLSGAIEDDDLVQTFE